MDDEEFERRIKNYLKENLEVVMTIREGWDKVFIEMEVKVGGEVISTQEEWFGTVKE